MKRNKLFIAGIVTVFVALLSLTLVSSTLAKYTSKATGSDTARVAYWGFASESELEISGLFKNAYSNVASKDTTDVIAPGAEGYADFTFVFDKKVDVFSAPEVAYSITVSTEGSEIADDLKTNANIQWKLDDSAWGTWDQLLDDIKALSGDDSGTAQYAAGSLPELSSKSHKIQWQWTFSTDAAGDLKDTTLANKDTLDEVTISIKVTATQVE